MSSAHIIFILGRDLNQPPFGHKPKPLAVDHRSSVTYVDLFTLVLRNTPPVFEDGLDKSYVKREAPWLTCGRAILAPFAVTRLLANFAKQKCSCHSMGQQLVTHPHVGD